MIRTAAVHDDNPEIAAALMEGIPVFERAQAWGAIMGHYKNALCVAGTHGKTTTTVFSALSAKGGLIELIAGQLQLPGGPFHSVPEGQPRREGNRFRYAGE